MTTFRSRKSGTSKFVTQLLVDINPRSGDLNGPGKKDYRSYIGMLVKTKFPIVIASWDDVVEVDKNLLR